MLRGAEVKRVSCYHRGLRVPEESITEKSLLKYINRAYIVHIKYESNTVVRLSINLVTFSCWNPIS